MRGSSNFSTVAKVVGWNVGDIWDVIIEFTDKGEFRRWSVSSKSLELVSVL